MAAIIVPKTAPDLWGCVRYKYRAEELASFLFHCPLFSDGLLWVSYKILWEYGAPDLW